MDNTKIRNILLKYEQRRDKNEYELEQRKNKISTKIPQIVEIDDEISKIGLKLAKSVLLNPSAREDIVKKSKEDIDKLKLEKRNFA